MKQILLIIFLMMNPILFAQDARPTTRTSDGTPTSADIPAFRRETKAAFHFAWNSLMATCGYPKPVKGDIPVVYSSQFEGAPLEQSEIAKIIQAARIVELRQELWFMTVDRRKKWGYQMKVYFAPEHDRGHVREGKVLVLSDSRIADLIIHEKGKNRGWHTDILETYIQVPPKSDGVKTGVPTGLSAPFPKPDDMSIDEIAEVVQFVQSNPVPEDPRQLIARVDATNPILRVSRDGGDFIIRTGIEQDPTFDTPMGGNVFGTRNYGPSGKGESIRCRKVNGKWALVRIGIWVL